MSNTDFIEELYNTIKSRKKSSPEESYVAKLFDKGRNKIAQKLGEEAVEVVIDAARDKKKGVISESADLLFHMLVLWADMGIKPSDVIEELQGRKGISGIAEKKNREN